jgi:hypothetical protein
MRTYIVKIWLKRFISMVEVQDRDAAKALVRARMAAQRIYLKQSLLKFGHQCTQFTIPAPMLWQTRI